MHGQNHIKIVLMLKFYVYVGNVHIVYFFIIIQTNAQISSVKLILKLLRHISVLIHFLQGIYKLCQLKL